MISGPEARIAAPQARLSDVAGMLAERHVFFIKIAGADALALARQLLGVVGLLRAFGVMQIEMAAVGVFGITLRMRVLA